jgi:nicotinate-nucleotide adenylyltransferase
MSSSPMTSGAAPLGLFGGTFDPVHFGHLRLAEEAREQLALEEVVWIPAGQPPLRDLPATSGADRVAMVRTAIADHPGFRIDTTEVELTAPSYTVLTLERWRQQVGAQRPLVLLLGADAFSRLEGWHRWRELFALAHIAVATRPGHELKVGAGETALDLEFRARRAAPGALAQTPAGSIVPFAIRPLDISATVIRDELRAGRDARYLAPAAVLDYIRRHSLYRNA